MLGYDVVVVGAELARMRVALAAKDNRPSVTVITKAHPIRSHSNATQAVINATLTDKNDNCTTSWL